MFSSVFEYDRELSAIERKWWSVCRQTVGIVASGGARKLADDRPSACKRRKEDGCGRCDGRAKKVDDVRLTDERRMDGMDWIGWRMDGKWIPYDDNNPLL